MTEHNLAKFKEQVVSPKRYLLGDTWHISCGVTIVMYLGIWLYYGVINIDSYQDPKYTIYEEDGKTIKAYDSDPDFQWLSSIACLAFACSAFKAIFSLLFIKPVQRPVVYCVIVINILAGHTHYSFFEASFPVLDSCFGRKNHVLRFAEWASLMFLLMFVLNALDCPDKRDFIRSTTLQTVSVILGYLSSFSCHRNWGGDDIEPSDGHWKHRGVSHPNESWFTPKAFVNSSRSFKICLLLLSISCWCFLDIYRVVLSRLADSRKNSMTASSPALSNVAGVSVCCAISWTIVVAVYFLGCFNFEWFDVTKELCAGPVVDFISKFMYANLLGDSHHHVQQLEATYLAQLQLKEEANKAQRQFLRYVFHEVRVPLNTIRLGLDSMNLTNSEDGTYHSERIDAPFYAENGDEVDHITDRGGGTSFGSSYSSPSHREREARLAVSRMDGAAEAMSETLNDVLSYQKIKEGNMELEVSHFKLENVFQKLSVGCRISFSDKELTLVTVLEEPLRNMSIQGDQARVRQVLNNFLNNALSRCHQAGDIILSAIQLSETPEFARKKSYVIPQVFQTLLNDSASSSSSSSSYRLIYVKFSVKDKGGTQSIEEQTKLLLREFSEIIRVGDKDLTGNDNGLTLCISKHMVELMGGEIGVKSPFPEKGSIFYFTIPLLLNEGGNKRKFQQDFVGSNGETNREIHSSELLGESEKKKKKND